MAEAGRTAGCFREHLGGRRDRPWCLAMGGEGVWAGWLGGQQGQEDGGVRVFSFCLFLCGGGVLQKSVFPVLLLSGFGVVIMLVSKVSWQLSLPLRLPGWVCRVGVNPQRFAGIHHRTPGLALSLLECFSP